MKYKTWLKTWLNNYVKPTTKERTFNRYSLTSRVHIIPNIGDYDMNELSPIVLQRFITDLSINGNKKRKGGLAANTLNSIITVIRHSLKTAYDLGITNIYIADKIKRPKHIERKVESFTVLEQKKIENAIINGEKDKMFGGILSLYTGLRIGELLALTWSDIDFDNRLLCVSKSCHDGKGGLIIDLPKTPNSKRIIPLPRQLIPILKRMRKDNSSEFVITSKNKPVSVRSYQRSFELLLKKLNLPHRGFHSLRHTFATRALECGMEIKTLAEILGHKNPTITLNRYAHSFLEYKTEMMNRIGKNLSSVH